MNEKSEPEHAVAPRRIILTVDVDSHLPSTLDLAAALAVAQRGALHGLFVEDVDLLNVAGLPFSQEVPLLCGRPRNLDDQVLERSLVRASQDFRRKLEEHAKRLSLSWSFATVRGRKQALELGEDGKDDILVIAQSPGRRQAPRKAHHRILLALDHSVLALPALRVILERNAGKAIELLVLEDAGTTIESAHPELLELLRQFPAARAVPRVAGELAGLVGQHERGLDCILVSRKIKPGQVRQILSLANCPVIVVS